MMSELGGMRRSAEDVGDDAVIDVRGLRMRYGSVDVLRGVEFVAHRGEVLALLGPNGAGKTTTIEILWRGSGCARRGRSGCWGLIRRRATRPGGHGSGWSCSPGVTTAGGG